MFLQRNMKVNILLVHKHSTSLINFMLTSGFFAASVFYVFNPSVGLGRLSLAYGGSDVTRTFFWLLQRAGFPYRDCQLSSRLDCQLLQHIKETFCHLNQVCWSGIGICVCLLMA